MENNKLGYDTEAIARCVIAPAAVGDPNAAETGADEGTFLGLMARDGEVVAVVHFDGEVMLDEIDPRRVRLIAE